MGAAITTKMLVENALNGVYREAEVSYIFDMILDNDTLDISTEKSSLCKVFKVGGQCYLIVDAKRNKYLAMWRSWCYSCQDPCSEGYLSSVNWRNLIEWRQDVAEMFAEDYDDTYKLVNDETLIEIED